MIAFPISIILLPYAAVLAVFLLFALINVYHLVHYGETTKVSFFVAFIFFAGASFILFFTWQLLLDTDWQRPIILSLPFLGGLGAPPTL